MAGHVLDNPVWHALATQHAGLALTADGAARYPAEIVPFAAVAEPTPRAADQLASLVDDAESVFVSALHRSRRPDGSWSRRRPCCRWCAARAPSSPTARR